MPKKEPLICPVCELPVGLDPHEDCLKQITDAMVEEVMPPMPCPACGKPMVNFECHNSDCENATTSS